MPMGNKPNTTIPDLYDKLSIIYAKEYNKPSYKIDQFINFLPPKAKILDVGCGPGKDAQYLCAQGHNVHGIDLSEKMIDLASKINSNCKFDVADMRELELESNSYDAVFVSFSLIHIHKKDLSGTLSKFYRCLKPEGIIFVGVQEGDSDEIVAHHPLDPKTSFFLNVMSSQELRELLKDQHFEILKQYRRPAVSEKELNFKKLILIAKKVSK